MLDACVRTPAGVRLQGPRGWELFAVDPHVHPTRNVRFWSRRACVRGTMHGPCATIGNASVETYKLNLRYELNDGKQPFCHPRQLCQNCRSWGKNHKRYTAVLIGPMMVITVYNPHGGDDEEDNIAELELVKIIMDEEREVGGKGFLIGGELIIELKWRSGEGEGTPGLDSLDLVRPMSARMHRKKGREGGEHS